MRNLFRAAASSLSFFLNNFSSIFLDLREFRGGNSESRPNGRTKGIKLTSLFSFLHGHGMSLLISSFILIGLFGLLKSFFPAIETGPHLIKCPDTYAIEMSAGVYVRCEDFDQHEILMEQGRKDDAQSLVLITPKKRTKGGPRWN